MYTYIYSYLLTIKSHLCACTYEWGCYMICLVVESIFCKKKPILSLSLKWLIIILWHQFNWWATTYIILLLCRNFRRNKNIKKTTFLLQFSCTINISVIAIYVTLITCYWHPLPFCRHSGINNLLNMRSKTKRCKRTSFQVLFLKHYWKVHGMV